VVRHTVEEPIVGGGCSAEGQKVPAGAARGPLPRLHGDTGGVAQHVAQAEGTTVLDDGLGDHRDGLWHVAQRFRELGRLQTLHVVEGGIRLDDDFLKAARGLLQLLVGDWLGRGARLGGQAASRAQQRGDGEGLYARPAGGGVERRRWLLHEIGRAFRKRDSTAIEIRFQGRSCD